MKTLAVIDYGMGNLRSVAKALEHVVDAQTRVFITSDPEQARVADRVVFPGQGAARDCMSALASHGLVEAVTEAAQTKPFLGICMGMQVLLDFSEENQGTDCLGVFPGRVRHFPRSVAKTDERLKIPHMGWNQVHQVRQHPLWQGISQDSRFYFVHSYYADPAQSNLVIGTTHYGVQFASAIAHSNLFAMQCHPEKSAGVGLKLLSNFARWDGSV